MLISHLGHAAVLVEAAGQRVLFDPGNFSHDWHDALDLDAICITHQHPDHVDADHLPGVIEANPGARVLVEADVPLTYSHKRMEAVRVGESIEVGDVTLTTHGGRHAIIHPDIPRIGNIGFTLSAAGEPTFFHPGDCLEATPKDVDVVAIAIHGPWAAMKENIDFVRALGAPVGFPIHEGLLNERGWSLIFGRLNAMTETRILDLRGAQPWEVSTSQPQR